MNDFEQIELTFDILESAEVVEVFDDSLLVRVSREEWNRLNLCPYHKRDCEEVA